MKKLMIALLLALMALGIWFFMRKQQLPSSELLKEQLTAHPLHHLGIIMDGNRRWAKKHGFKPWIGHKEGVKSVKAAIEFSLEFGIKELTLYVLSLENLKRPEEELAYLFDILAPELAGKEFDELFKQGIHVRFIGDRTKFPAQLVPIITDIEKKTATHDKLFLNLLFCYGGQQELVAAAQKICTLCAEKKITPESIDKEIWMQALWSGALPPLDLIIRTAGDQRLSNYLPVQSAYADLYFTSTLWPDLTKEELFEAVKFFLKAKHTLGT